MLYWNLFSRPFTPSSNCFLPSSSEGTIFFKASLSGKGWPSCCCKMALRSGLNWGEAKLPETITYSNLEDVQLFSGSQSDSISLTPSANATFTVDGDGNNPAGDTLDRSVGDLH